MALFNEKIIKITKYDVLGKLPDPFLRADGTRVSSVEEFEEHKKELYKSAVELQYGEIPPEPEFLEVETLYIGAKTSTYKIITGRQEHPVSFTMIVYRPAATQEKPPVIIDGDLCFDCAFDKEFLGAVLDENIGFVLFNRTELAHDVQHEGRLGQLYECYPEYTFGALAAWAWGYKRCVDALEKLDLFDMDWIAFTGHSRGGKTAALAGIIDQRAKIVMPNETCAGSCSCYRIHLSAITEDGEGWRSETLADLYSRYDFWVGPNMANYTECEEKLPFDAHYIKSLIAPRILIVGEAASDIWSNPVGSWMTSKAAEEVYKLYSCPDNLFWYFRYGYHNHKVEDLKMLVSVIKHKRDGEPLAEGFFDIPFEEPELIYDWRCPTVSE